MVPEVRLELTLCCQKWILSPSRLPIPPLGHNLEHVHVQKRNIAQMRTLCKCLYVHAEMDAGAMAHAHAHAHADAHMNAHLHMGAGSFPISNPAKMDLMQALYTGAKGCHDQEKCAIVD